MSAVALAIILLGVASRGQYWHAVVLAVALVYGMLAITRWSSAAQVVVVAFLAVPIIAVIPALGGAYPVYAALALLSVGLVGLSKRGRLAHVPIAAFLVWQLGGAVWTYATIGGMTQYYLLATPAAMLGLYLVMQTEGERLAVTLVSGVIALSALESVLGLSQTFFGGPNFEAVGAPVFVESRNYFGYVIPGVSTVARLATGTFEHFNGLGALLAIGTTMCFWYWMQKKTVVRFALLSLVASGLVSTFSRGSLIGALCGCALVFTVMAKPGWRFPRVLAVLSLGLLVTVLAWSEILSYAAETSNLSSRQQVWGVALADYGTDPVVTLLGRGFGYFQMLLSASGLPTTRLHSAPFQLLLEQGLVGVALFVNALWHSFRRASGEWSGLSVPSAGGVTALLVASIFDNSFAGPMGALAIGLLVVVASQCEGDRVVVAPRGAGVLGVEQVADQVGSS